MAVLKVITWRCPGDFHPPRGKIQPRTEAHTLFTAPLYQKPLLHIILLQLSFAI